MLLGSSKLLGFCQFFSCKSKAYLFKCTVDELPSLFSFAQSTEVSAMEFCSIIAKKKPTKTIKLPLLLQQERDASAGAPVPSVTAGLQVASRALTVIQSLCLCRSTQ